MKEEELKLEIKSQVEKHPTWIDLSECAIECEGAAILARRLPKGLKSLDISLNYIYIYGSMALSRNMVEGLEVFLADNNAGDGNQAFVSILDKLPNSLKRLSLRGNGIAHYGAILLSQNMPKELIELDLSFNNFSDESAIILAESLPKKLKKFSLLYTVVGWTKKEITDKTKEKIKAICKEKNIKLEI